MLFRLKEAETSLRLATRWLLTTPVHWYQEKYLTPTTLTSQRITTRLTRCVNTNLSVSVLDTIQLSKGGQKAYSCSAKEQKRRYWYFLAYVMANVAAGLFLHMRR